MYNDHISYLVNGWWDFYKHGIILKYQIKITHHWNFQNLNLCLIYLTFNLALKSMGKAHLINVFV
jgi:hypothetical protein